MRVWLNRVGVRVLGFFLVLSSALLLTEVTGFAEPTLDSAINNGFGKLVKYGRWTAALVLAVLFCLSWAQRSQNAENPHEVHKSTKSMIWTGAGFVAVIGYKLILTGLVSWFDIDPNAIPAFLWQ